MKRKILFPFVVAAAIFSLTGNAACSPKHVHDYTQTVTTPTCSLQGYTTFTCECGESYVADYIQPFGHIFSEDVCSTCGEHRPSEGLAFLLNDDKSTYKLAYCGTCTDTEMYIPSTYKGKLVTAISNNALMHNAITSVTIPDSVTEIGESAFRYCNGLTTIHIPDGVTKIGDAAFANCENLQSVTLGKNVKTVGDYVFEGCLKLKNLEIPDGIQSLGTPLLSNCLAFTYNEYEGGYYVGNEANPYLALVGLKSPTVATLSIHEQTKLIGGGAFENSELTSVILPDSVEYVNKQAFAYCSNLYQVTLSKNVKVIGARAFNYCNLLQELVLPDSVEVIEQYAFGDCDGLQRITLGSGLRYIEPNAFHNTVTELKTIFKNPEGWVTCSNTNFKKVEEMSATDLADAWQATDLLRFRYAQYYWKRGN